MTPALFDLLAFRMDANTTKLLATRQHQILKARSDQIRTNLLAYHGGSPYIEARLSRFPSESETDWAGDSTSKPASLGRKDRAFLVNYSKRIAHKINQYVFQSDVRREGIADSFALDCTSTGMSINQFMAEVSSLITVGRWCWIGIDRPQSSGPRSIAAREVSGDRVYWQLYAPSEVVDWRFDARGGIDWLITERSIYDNSDPRTAPVENRVRFLYEPGRVTRMVFDEKGEGFKATDETPIGIREVPFIQCGLVTSEPWWFDDVERIQRAIMDLLSSRDTQIFKSVFAMLVVSETFRNAMVSESIQGAEFRKKVGTGNPIFEGEKENGLTRYVDVPSSVFAVIQDAKKDLESSLYDIVGLNMSVPESRQVASAEAKAWDHMDPAAVLKERATLLEEVETKAVELSRKLGGPIFSEYAPVYGKTFDISDFNADIAAITSTAGFTLSPKSEKLVQKALVSSFGRRFGIDASAALAEIDATEETPPVG